MQDTRCGIPGTHICGWRLWLVFLEHGGALGIFKSPVCTYLQWSMDLSLSASRYPCWASVAGDVCRPRSEAPCINILRSFFWAGSVGTFLASHKLPPEHRLRLLLAGPFQLFFAFYTFFVLTCSHFLYVYVSSVSSCTRAAVATPQPTAKQQQHNDNSSRYIQQQ